MARQPSLDTLRKRARSCEQCDLFRRATQTVFGEGPQRAELVIVGEQPGDQEDRKGHPFVGPAGQLLDRALDAAGIDRSKVYVTNAVKHFKWREQGKRRIHEKPNREEILACRGWLEEEIQTIRPRAILALGATAAASLFGPKVRVMRDRGTWLESPLAEIATVTVHPSAILRSGSDEDREKAFRQFTADLKRLQARLEK